MQDTLQAGRNAHRDDVNMRTMKPEKPQTNKGALRAEAKEEVSKHIKPFRRRQHGVSNWHQCQKMRRYKVFRQRQNEKLQKEKEALIDDEN